MSFFEQTTKDGAEVLIEDSDAPVTGGSCPITGAAGAACPASNVGNPGDE
jgi:hypothetical protein